MSEKTEQPTPKKLRDARQKGQVAKSKEVVSVAIIISICLLLYAFRDYYLHHLSTLMLLPGNIITLPFQQAIGMIMPQLLSATFYLLWPLIAIVFVIAIASNMGQFGFIFSGESVKPDIKKINPVEGFKKIFSMKSLIEFIKSVIKILLLTLLVFLVIKANISEIVKIPYCNSACAMSITGELLKQLMIFSGIGFIIIAVGDYFFERYQHTKELKMSIEEVQREYKEMEGNPEIKSKRKQFHRELQSASTQDNVKRSSVVVTNPTHIAVALYYKQDETPLPLVTIKGKNLLAKEIVKYAREANIPILQKVPLARALMTDAEVDQFIPAQLIEPVAEVIRWLDSLEAH